MSHSALRHGIIIRTCTLIYTSIRSTLILYRGKIAFFIVGNGYDCFSAENSKSTDLRDCPDLLHKISRASRNKYLQVFYYSFLRHTLYTVYLLACLANNCNVYIDLLHGSMSTIKYHGDFCVYDGIHAQ